MGDFKLFESLMKQKNKNDALFVVNATRYEFFSQTNFRIIAYQVIKGAAYKLPRHALKALFDVRQVALQQSLSNCNKGRRI